jgi:hypothetical protein
MPGFPNWRSRITDFFALRGDVDAIVARARYGLRGSVRGRNAVAPDLAYEFIRTIAREAGIDMPNSPAAPVVFLDPGSMQYISIPTSIQELVAYMQALEERYELAMDEILDYDADDAAQDLDEPVIPQAVDDQGEPTGPMFDEDDMGQDVYQPEQVAGVEYSLAIEYTWIGWDGHNTWVLPGSYTLDDETVAALGPNSALDSIARVDLVFNTLGLVDPDTIKPDGASGAWVTDVYIANAYDPSGARPPSFTDHAIAGESAVPLAGNGAGTPVSSSTVQGVSPPGRLSDFHEQLGYRDPRTRLSYDSGAIRVDHPGIKYSAELVERGSHVTAVDYACPWLRANYIENCCWLTCIIDLVNTSMRRKVLTYERLWTIMGKPGAFDPAEVKLGLSIRDVEAIFEYFDRAVVVIDGENNVVYKRERSPQRRKNHIRPEAWSFLMTEHHVTVLNKHDLFKPQIDGKRLNFGAGGFVYDEVIIDHPYEVVSPEFPPRETKKPSMLESYESKSKTRTIKGLVNVDRKRKATSVVKLLDPDMDLLLQRESAHDDKVTLHEAMFHTRYTGTHLTVIASKRHIPCVVLKLVKHYHYKPSIVVDTSGSICAVSINSLDNRASVLIKSLLPGNGSVFDDEAEFTSVEEAMRYCMIKHTLTAKLLRADNQSFMHESVAQICHTYTRGGFFHMFQDMNAIADTPAKFNSCDMNRLYPSTLLVDELPRVDLFNRFETIDTVSDYYKLMPHDLVVVSINDSASVYIDQPINLCFKKNLDLFLQRPSVQMCEPSTCHATLDRPSGCTLVTVHAVLCTHMGHSTVSNAISTAWHDTTVSRSMRKYAINSAIGSLGKRFNRSNSKGSNLSFTVCFHNREEAGLHAEQTGERIISLQDELYFALPNSDQVPRLQGGYLMHLWVLDHARWAMQETYDRFVEAGVDVVGIMCDELYYPSHQQPLVDQFIYDGDNDSFRAFGKLKPHACNVAASQMPRRRNFSMADYVTPSPFDLNVLDETCVPMNVNTVIPVSPGEDEFNIGDLSEYTRLLVKANVPGAGKSHTVLSKHADNCVVVCPTNSLCVEFSKRYPGCTAITLHKFLRIRHVGSDDQDDDHAGSNAGLAMKQIECNRVLLLDEIYMYPQSLLNKLYVRLCTTHATHVYATGDPNQLPPVEDDKKTEHSARYNKENLVPNDVAGWDPMEDAFSDPTYVTLHERRSKSIDHLFPRQMTLTKCKRATSHSDNVRMEYICKSLRDPFADVGAVDLVKRHFMNVSFADAVTMLKTHPDHHVAVCYYNATCNAVAKQVYPDGLLQEGVRLVNRQRYVGKGGVVLHVNYEYVVKEVLETQVVLQDDDEGLVAVPIAHAERHMMWWRTRTCHSLQGTSVSGSVIIFDLECPHMSKEFIYVALTRARNLSGVCYVA